jgi:putative membrane protein
VPDLPQDDPRIYFAAERTLLAWIRTGLAMMGFGFVVARFGLFLRELQAAHEIQSARSSHGSVWFGTVLVLMGVVVNLSAALQHMRLVRQLQQGEWSPRVSRSGIAVAFALALAGLAVTIYLLSIR